MNLIARAALELMTAFWVFQSAVALIKTRKASRLYATHRRWLDKGGKAPVTKRVVLVIAVKGVSPTFERFLDFALGQDYPDYRVIFVTESESDPAHAAISRRPDPKARLIVAGNSTDTGQKVHNQLAALAMLEPTDRLVAFADGDLLAGTDWLSCLALPLNAGQADFTTGYRWFVPANRRLPNRVVAIIGIAIEPLIGPNWRMCLWGGSMAMTREVFDELEIPRQLRGSVNDDARISQVARRAGKKMRYVRSVAAASPVDFTWATLVEFGRRQYFQLRIYQPSLWWMAMAIQLFYLVGFTACLARLAMGNPWMLVPVMVVLACNIARTRVRRAYLQARFRGGAMELDEAVRNSGWLDPLVNAIHLLIILSSACGREIVWAGTRYRVSGPQKTEVLANKN